MVKSWVVVGGWPVRKYCQLPRSSYCYCYMASGLRGPASGTSATGFSLEFGSLGKLVDTSIYCNEVGLSEYTLRLIDNFVQRLRQHRLYCVV